MFDEKRLKETFDQVHASDGLLEEVLEMTTKSNRKQYRPKHITRTLLIAALLVCALTMSVTAAEAIAKKFSGDTTPIVDAFFGENGAYSRGDSVVEYDEWGKLKINMPAWSREPANLELAERLVAPYLYTLEENTVTKGGFTYTIHAVLYDSSTKTALIRWSVENPDGLGKYGVGVNGEFNIQEGSDMVAVAGGRDYVDSVNSTETKLYISSYTVDWQDELYCEFGCWYDWDKGKTKAWIDSEKIILPRVDRGGMQTVSVGDVTISPVAIRFEGMHVDYLRELIIRYKDGGEYRVFSDEPYVSNTTYGLGSEDAATYTFNRIVDVEQIVEITVNGEVFPVE